jgi:hypothetical protein
VEEGVSQFTAYHFSNGAEILILSLIAISVYFESGLPISAAFSVVAFQWNDTWPLLRLFAINVDEYPSWLDNLIFKTRPRALFTSLARIAHLALRSSPYCLSFLYFSKMNTGYTAPSTGHLHAARSGSDTSSSEVSHASASASAAVTP